MAGPVIFWVFTLTTVVSVRPGNPKINAGELFAIVIPLMIRSLAAAGKAKAAAHSMTAVLPSRRDLWTESALEPGSFVRQLPLFDISSTPHSYFAIDFLFAIREVRNRCDARVPISSRRHQPRRGKMINSLESVNARILVCL